MGFRFNKSIRLAPGIRINLNKTGPSISLGGAGASVNIGPRGARTTVGAPGTGVSYRKEKTWGGLFGGKRSGAKTPPKKAAETAAPARAPDDKFDLGWLERLMTPDDEEAFVAGLAAYVRGDEAAALERLKAADHLPDGAYLAGVLALKREDFPEAARLLEIAAGAGEKLGALFAKYGVSSEVAIPITEEIVAEVGADRRGALLALAEARQALGRNDEAAAALRALVPLAPEDVVLRASLAELILDARPNDRAVLEEVLRLAEGATNESPVHTALLLFRVRALRGLGLREAAAAAVAEGLRRTKDRSQDLLLALRYERALLYEAAGEERRARAEWEKLYAERPDYEDVRRRLGL